MQLDCLVHKLKGIPLCLSALLSGPQHSLGGIKDEHHCVLLFMWVMDIDPKSEPQSCVQELCSLRHDSSPLFCILAKIFLGLFSTLFIFLGYS